MDIKEVLIEKAKEQGIDPDEVVYSICIADILECIAEYYEEDCLKFPLDKIKALIEKGVKRLDWLAWNETITLALES